MMESFCNSFTGASETTAAERRPPQDIVVLELVPERV